jgi:hypothetical protein
MARIFDEELSRLTAEVLPERAVLSVVGSPGHGSTTIAFACQGSTGGGQSNLFDEVAGALIGTPVGSADGGVQCVPAAIVISH